MPAPESTFNQFAIDKLLAPTADVLKPDMSVNVPKFEVPQVGYGNIDFPYGYSKNKHVDNPVAASVNKLFSSGPTQNFMGSPVTYNADEINAARYVVSPDYHKLGISLTGNNEENYGQNQSWSEVLSNGTVGMGKLAYNGFVDGWKGWGRMTDALVHWDWDKLHGDSESMMDMDNTLKDIMNLNPIYATKQGSDTFWNRQTFGNFLQQSGFAVGAGLQMLSEQVITKAIEAGLTATGVGAVGAGALEVIEDVNTAAKVGRIARMFQKGKEFYDAAKNFKVLKKAGDIFTNEKLLTNFVTGIAEKIPGVDIAMDISKTYEAGKLAGLSGGKLAGDITKVGLGGLKRTLSEANFAFTEARMEAAGTFTDMYNQLQDDHFKKTGKYATDDTLQGMQDVAMKAADKNFNFNSALLAVSNRIMFDNIFKNSKATSKILSQFGEDVGEKGLKVLGEINGRTTTQYYTGSAFSNFKTISEDFGIKKARQVLAGSVMKGALKFETTEGIQELLQEGSNNYFKDYYTDSYNSKFNPDIKADKTRSFNKAVESQMNMQGLKTFASGALTGLMLHGPTVLLGKAASKIGTSIEDKYKTQGFTKEQTEKYYEDKKTAKEEEKNKYVEFNAIAKDPSKFFSESVKNFNIQKEAASALNEAAKVDDKFAYENIRTDALHSMIASSIRNDTHEGLLDTLKEYGKHLTKEEFEQAFVGLDYTSENKKATSDYTNKVANSIESYIKIKNKLNSKYGSIANPNRYAFGTEEFHKELVKKQTLDNMIDVIAGNEFKATDALERSTRIFSTLASHKTLGNSLSSAFNILGSDDALQNELNVLDAEINIKKQQLQTEGLSKQDKDKLKKEIELKEKQHKNIVKWSENKLITTNKAKIAKAQSSFKAYLELKNEEYGRPTTINQDEVDDMFFAFNDYIKLNKKSQDHVNAINMITNPDYFDQIHDRMIRAATLTRFKMMAEAAEEHIKTNKDGEFFVIKIDNSFVLFSPTGEPIEEYDTIEEANKIKKQLNDSITSDDELKKMFESLEVKEGSEELKPEETTPEETKPETKKPETKTETSKLLINGRYIVTTGAQITDGKKIISYYFEDDPTKEINELQVLENGKRVDVETGEELIVTNEILKTETKEKSIDEKIAELQAKIDALPNKGIVMEGEMITSSKELKDLNKQIEDLKKQQELEKEKSKLKVAEVKERLKKLNEKKLIVDPNDSNYYINESDPTEKYARVSTLKEEYDGPKTDAADRGTIIDSLLRDFIANKITTLEEFKKAYNDHKLKDQVATFNDSFLNNIYNIFKEVKDVTEKQGLELISDIPTLWGKLNDKDYAGSIDLLGISKDGDVYIIDLKTSSQNRRDASGAYYKKFKDGDTTQQSAYAELLRQTTGITVKSVVIFPIQIFKKDNKYNSAIANKDESGKLTMSVTIDKTLFPEKKEELVVSTDAKNTTVKIETYEGVYEDTGETHIVTVRTMADGSKIIQEKIKGDKIPFPQERIKGDQLNLPIENFTSLSKGSLTKVSEKIIDSSTTFTDAKADVERKTTKVISSEIVEKGNRKGQTRTVTQTNSVENVEGTLVSVTEYEAKIGDTRVTEGGRKMTFKEFKEEFPLDEEYKEILADYPDLNDDTIITVIKVKRTPTSSKFSTVVSISSFELGGKMDITIEKDDAKYDAELVALEGKTPITEEELEEEKKGVEDIDQTFNDKKDKIDGDSLDSEKIFQEGVKQTAPALSLGNRTHAVNVVQVSPAFERFERGEVNKTYEFEVATPTFMPGKSITFKVDEFDDKDFDKSNIGIYTTINGKETRIGAVHTPQWISEQRGSNDAYTHIVIPENEKNDKFPKTLQTELETNRKLRKLILDNHKLDSNFVLNGIVNDKSNGIVVTTEKAGLLKDRINPEVGKGGLENRHGMFGIIRNGYIEISKGVQINADQLAAVKSFDNSNISNYEGYSIFLVPTPTGLYFPTFMKIPNVAREQSEFILKAWKIFTGRESGNEFIKAVYTAQGSVYVENSTPNINILKDYINHYITNLSSKSLSQIGNGEDAPDNTSRIDIFDDGNIKLQGKKNGKWMNVTIRKEQDIPSDVLDYMDGLLTSVRFTDNKNDNLVGINSEDKFTLLGVKNDKLISNNTTYNKYIMDGAMTHLDKGIESNNADNDWVYFANPVVKFQYSEPSKDLYKDAGETKKPEVILSDVTETPKVDKAAALLAALKAERLKREQVENQKDKCSGN